MTVPGGESNEVRAEVSTSRGPDFINETEAAALGHVVPKPSSTQWRELEKHTLP